MDDSLRSYARARLLRARPDLDHRDVEAYVTSPAFAALVSTLDRNLMNELDRYLASEKDAAMNPPATPASPPTFPLPSVPEEEVRPYALPELEASPADSAGPKEAPVTPMKPEAFEAIAPDTAAESPAPQASAPAPAAAAQPAMRESALRLPNARAGTLYTQRIELPGAADGVVFEEILVPDGLALSGDLATGTLSGTPQAAGDYRLTLAYHLTAQPAAPCRAVVQLSVTPDPRTMWKNLPSDRSDPYWKEDQACASVQGPAMRIVAASTRGRSHAHVGGFRDDDYAVSHLGDNDNDSGWYLAVVADGAGSAKFSRRGAALICEEASRHVQAALGEAACARIDAAAEAYAQAGDEERAARHAALHSSLSRVVGNAAYYAVRAIMEETLTRGELGGVFKDYASTALIGICKRYSFGTLCAAYWVGDGAVGVYSRRDGITLLGEVDSGEFSGQTRFLDTAAIEHDMLLKRTRFALVEDMTAFVLMTDGVSDAKFETEARLQRAADWHAFWDELDAAVDFAGPGDGHAQRLCEWLGFWSQGNHDDRTIALILQSGN